MPTPDFFDARDHDAEALQDDLDFWLKKLAASRWERENIEKEIEHRLHEINTIKRKAHAKRIELK